MVSESEKFWKNNFLSVSKAIDDNLWLMNDRLLWFSHPWRFVDGSITRSVNMLHFGGYLSLKLFLVSTWCRMGSTGKKKHFWKIPPKSTWTVFFWSNYLTQLFKIKSRMRSILLPHISFHKTTAANANIPVLVGSFWFPSFYWLVFHMIMASNHGNSSFLWVGVADFVYKRNVGNVRAPEI